MGSQALEADNEKKKPSGEETSALTTSKANTNKKVSETVENLHKQAASPTPASKSIDAHPYARGSVIEVLHGKTEEEKESFWWSESSDEESQQEEKEQEKALPENEAGSSGITVRLCDIIDRVSTDDGAWRYYVHYKDFNRRMDEWIAISRIVSPPSIGNAKARALKKQEEKLKRKLAKEQQLEEEQNLLKKIKRRSSTGELAPNTPADEKTPRMTRRQRRKSDFDIPSLANDRFVGSEEKKQTSGNSLSPANSTADHHQMVKMIATTAAAETTKIGDHVVATIPAQELDEHEGLDEASLREHEEVTKVCCSDYTTNFSMNKP